MKLLSLSINGTPIEAPPEINAISKSDNVLENIIGNAFEIIIILVVVLALIFIIFSGIQWITSGGDKQKLSAARSRLIYAIIGLIVVLLAVFIVNTLGGFFDLNLIQN